MPELEKYPVPLYDPLHPYHWEYDNLPLQALKLRDEVINGQVDYNSGILMDAAGNQGSVANRLNQSINADGSLKSSAIDEELHNVAAHTDGSKIMTAGEIAAYATLGYVVSNPVPFVRMLSSERDKLSLIADEATSLAIQVQTPSTTILFNHGSIRLIPSTTVQWNVTAGNEIQANMAFPAEAAHRHYYDLEPVTTDHKNYTTTSVSTPYMDGTLRVFINGVRISESANVYVPGDVVSDPWMLNSFAPDDAGGSFVLTNAITVADTIRIDFDIALT